MKFLAGPGGTAARPRGQAPRQTRLTHASPWRRQRLHVAVAQLALAAGAVGPHRPSGVQQGHVCLAADQRDDMGRGRPGQRRRQRDGRADGGGVPCALRGGLQLRQRHAFFGLRKEDNVLVCRAEVRDAPSVWHVGAAATVGVQRREPENGAIRVVGQHMHGGVVDDGRRRRWAVCWCCAVRRVPCSWAEGEGAAAERGVVVGRPEALDVRAARRCLALRRGSFVYM